jgi:dihydrofolate reductase
MGGAQTGRQYIRGVVDELSIHLVLILLGAGTRKFDHLADEHVELEQADVIKGQKATHLRFRIVKPGASGR